MSPIPLSEMDIEQAMVLDPLVCAPNEQMVDVLITINSTRATCPISTRVVPETLVYTDARASCVLVVDRTHLIGIFTERDIIRLSAQGQQLAGVAIAQVMTQPVVSIRQRDLTDPFKVIHLFQYHCIRHLPVVDDQEQVVGLLTHESMQQLLHPMDLFRLQLVSDVMIADVVQATPTTSVLQLTQLMAERRVSSVAIVEESTRGRRTENGGRRTEDERGRTENEAQEAEGKECSQTLKIPVGIVTERDIVQFQALGLDLKRIRARKVMSAPVLSTHPAESLWSVRMLMQAHWVRRVVVTGNQGELLGIITQSSLLQAMNPLDMYRAVGVLQQKVSQLEADKMALLQTRNTLLEQQVQERTAALQARAERERLMTQISTLIGASLDLQQVLNTAVTEVQAFLGCDRVCLYQFQPDWSAVVVAERTARHLPSHLNKRVYDPCFAPDWIVPYSNGRVRVVSDIYAIEMAECHRQLLERLQIRAKILVPIVQGEQLWGLLTAVESSDPREWQPEEVILLEQLSTQLAIAIAQATAYQQTQTELAERHRAEAALHKSEQQLREAQRIARLGSWELDRVQHQLSWSDEIFRILDRNPRTSKAVDEILRDAIHPDDRERVDEVVAQSMRDRIPYDITYRLKRPNGRIKYVREQCETDYDNQGNPLRSLGTIQDITERKQVERDLQQLIEGAAAFTGEDFFGVLAEYIATVLDVRYVVASKLEQTYLRTYAFWADGKLQPTTTFSLVNTPCGRTIQTGGFCCPAGVQQHFPGNESLCQLEVEGYVGAALTDIHGKAIGSLCVLHDRPLHQVERIEGILRVFAARVGAEVERQSALQALRQLNSDLETKVEERTAALQAERDRVQRQTIALRQSQAELRAIFDLAAVGIVQIDALSYRFLKINQKFCDVLGYTQKDLFQQTFVDLTHPEDLASTWAAIKRLDSGEVNEFVMEKRYLHQNGTLLWSQTTVSLVRKPDDSPDYYIAIVNDISDRKRAEHELQQSKEMLQLVLDTIPQRVFWKDRHSVLLGCNRNFAQDVGLAPENVPGKRDRDLSATSEEIEHYQACDRRVLTTGKSDLHILETFHKPDGSIRWLETNKVPMRDASGEIIGILATYDDITPRREAEIALRESEERLQDFLDNASDLIQSVSLPEGRLLYVNRTWLDVLGYTQEDVQHLTIMDILAPDCMPHCAELFQQFCQGLVDRADSIEVTFLAKDGRKVLLEGNINVRKENNRPALTRAIFHDITERRAFEEQLRHKNAELARATRLKDEFLANMSHELRTPLNAILGMSEGLQDQIFGFLNERQQQALTTIERSGRHLLDLINDILDLAKIEAGKLELQPAPVSIHWLCESSLTFVKQLAIKKKVQLQSKIQPSLDEIEVDELRIRQLLINLLTNAVKFTPSGGCITLDIQQESSPENPAVSTDWLCISVIDTGIGIAQDDVDKLFQAFVQIDSNLNRQHTGTGLGLALVKQIAKLHGGSVSIRSEVGKGSCFTVRLPYINTQNNPTVPGHLSGVGDVSEVRQSPVFSIGQTSGGSPRILLAEDNPANISTVSSYLESRGYQLLLAQNGYDAIDLATTQNPDLILMDIQMPELDGLAATRQIRANPTLADIPIIALTALAMPGDREKCLDAGADEYLAKPVRLRKLTETIQSLLEVKVTT